MFPIDSHDIEVRAFAWHSHTCSATVYVWDTLRQCVKFVIMINARQIINYTYETFYI